VNEQERVHRKVTFSRRSRDQLGAAALHLSIAGRHDLAAAVRDVVRRWDENAATEITVEDRSS
jgi:hypothetical protein